MSDSIIGLVFDTTSSNTGLAKGSVTKIAKGLDKFLLLLACRHHIMELRIGKFFNTVTGEATSGPENLLFKKLKSQMESVNFEVDYTKLNFFNKSKVIGTVAEEGARESADFCKAYLSRKDIVREDRRELAELVVLYLNKDKDIKIRKAGALHHARFLSKCLYTLKIVLLAQQIEFETETIEALRNVSEFICCFYAVWYLQSHEAVRAPHADAIALHQMIRYKDLKMLIKMQSNMQFLITF